jgi:hypothetical protein
VSTQTTKEYPAPVVPPRTKTQSAAPQPPGPAGDEPDIHVQWTLPDMSEVRAVERALDELDEPIPGEARMASGSGPATPVDGTPMVHPERKRAQSRPSMKAVLAGEIDTESELDVPTFIRRHSATLG